MIFEVGPKTDFSFLSFTSYTSLTRHSTHTHTHTRARARTYVVKVELTVSCMKLKLVTSAHRYTNALSKNSSTRSYPLSSSGGYERSERVVTVELVHACLYD
jgi:hypothetical protein